uniref:Large ribosomal subunit protein uL3c n=1 Tax=Taenioma perpusillum TaxID=210852 RepID=A0A1Z1MRZ7_9FLOR|nr:ribosomal protein L3 [Taenioma perpusillum]ARW68541.1 ribosomal protein L3 [Taenioma perpusillum]
MSPIGILGIKLGMTQIFNEKGDCIPVTILKAGPCTITKINNLTDTYRQIQIGYDYIDPQKISKSMIGYFNKIKTPCFRYLKEYKIIKEESNKFQVGQIVTIKSFQIGDLLDISGISIGKGFSGYQKRHNFSRGPMSHGSKNHRQPGSIGAGTTPGRVFPGKRMAGRMGSNKTTIKNLKIIDLNLEENIIVIKGSVPGKKGNILYLRS